MRPTPRQRRSFAASEAVSNAVEHAYQHDRSRADPAPLVVVMAVTDVIDSERPGAKVIVEDFGAWRSGAPDAGTRGHGLRMIAALMESCSVDRRRSGTRVTLISKPVRGHGQRRPRVPAAENGTG